MHGRESSAPYRTNQIYHDDQKHILRKAFIVLTKSLKNTSFVVHPYFPKISAIVNIYHGSFEIRVRVLVIHSLSLSIAVIISSWLEVTMEDLRAQPSRK